MARKDNTKKKNQQYDAVYYLRNRKARMAENMKRAMAPEQKLYRQLYIRWRVAVKGEKVPINEAFDKPSKETRLQLLELKEKGCAHCEVKEKLHLDHVDAYPNNNALTNLQWLCNGCHKEKTARERKKGAYFRYENLAKKPPGTKK